MSGSAQTTTRTEMRELGLRGGFGARLWMMGMALLAVNTLSAVVTLLHV